MPDDTQLLQSQINAGGVVQLEARDYVVTGLKIPTGLSRAVTIRGQGRAFVEGMRASVTSGTRLICTGGADAVAYDGSAAGATRPTITIEHMSIFGPNELNDRTLYSAGHGIRINGGQSVPLVFLRDVLVAGFYGGCGVWLSNCENGTVSDLHTLFCGIGFKADMAHNANTHINLSAERCVNGIIIDGGESLAFLGGMVQSNEQSGLVLKAVNGVHVAGLHVENNNRLSVADSWGVLIEGPSTGVSFDGLDCINPRDTVCVRGTVRGARFAGRIQAAAPVVTLGVGVRGTQINECVPPASVALNGAVGTRIVWDGVVSS